MTLSEWIQLLTVIGAVASGLFAFVKWRDQRNRELDERRFEQYWKLVDTTVETPFLAKQKVALLLLKRYMEFRNETIAFLSDARASAHPWASQNAAQIDDVLNSLRST